MSVAGRDHHPDHLRRLQQGQRDVGLLTHELRRHRFRARGDAPMTSLALKLAAAAMAMAAAGDPTPPTAWVQVPASDRKPYLAALEAAEAFLKVSQRPEGTKMPL